MQEAPDDVVKNWMRNRETIDFLGYENISIIPILNPSNSTGLKKPRAAMLLCCRPKNGLNRQAQSAFSPNPADTAARWIFLYGYEKSERDNITQAELAAWKLFAHDLLERSDTRLKILKANKALKELDDE